MALSGHREEQILLRENKIMKIQQKQQQQVRNWAQIKL
jgi:hypothetical protein